MDTNKQLKLRRISTIFSSCRHNDTTTTNTPNKTPSPLNPKSKPPTHPFPSIHKPNTPTPKFTIRSHKPDPARQKLSESYNYSLFYSAHSAPLLEKQSMQKQSSQKKQSKRDKKMRRKRREVQKARSFVTTSSDDEVGSSSRRRLLNKRNNNDDDDRETELRKSDCCYAIVKCSEDPYMDFRTSMVEMIVEKRMSKAEDLEKLLQCFLKINSYRHHEVIIEAFMEIWDALFLYSTM